MSTSIYPILSYANCLCLGIDKELGSSRLISEERKDSIKVGYKNIVREALRKRVDLLRDNKLPDYHYDAGVILRHKKNELLYVLEQKEYKCCSDRYNNFTFRSPKCLKKMINNDDLLCNECDDILIKL